MRRNHSESFPLWIIGAVFALTWAFKSIYEDALKAVALKYLNQWFGTGPVADLMSNILEIVPAVGLAIAIVWLLYRYVERQFARRSLAFVRRVQSPEGDFGHYTAFVTVENTSRTDKLENCRCEIA